MSRKKLATVVAAGALVLGGPAAFALADGKACEKDNGKQPKGCEDDGHPGNPDEDEDDGEGGGEAPSLPGPADLEAIIAQVTEQLPGGGGEPGEPGLPPEVQAVVDEVTGGGGGEDPAAQVQAAVDEAVAGLPQGPPEGVALPEEAAAALAQVREGLPPEGQAAFDQVVGALPIG